MAKKVLITGVAGFIGSNLLDYLLEKTDWEIDGIDNFSTGRKSNIAHVDDKRFQLIQGSVRDLKSLKSYDIIFHLAALPRIQPSFELIIDHINENLINTIHLIELMIQDNHYPRFVNSSSSAIYGTPKTIPTPETAPFNSLSPYAYQKEEVEKYFSLLESRYPLDYVHLRYFNPYGPRSFNPENKFNAYSSVVGIFLHRKKHGLPLLVTGEGKQKRDFIHVRDLARANYMAAVHPTKLNTAFNIGNGSTLSIIELAKMIDKDNYQFIPKREGEAEITFADISKAKNILGWEPTGDIEKYIQEELKSYQEKS